MIRIPKPWEKALAKTRQGFLERMNGLFRGSAGIAPSLYDGLEELLIEADVGAELAQELVEGVRGQVKKMDSPGPDDVRFGSGAPVFQEYWCGQFIHRSFIEGDSGNVHFS